MVEVNVTSLISLMHLVVGDVEKAILFPTRRPKTRSQNRETAVCPQSRRHPSQKCRAVVSKGVHVFLVESGLINAGDCIVFVLSGVPEVGF